MATKNSSYWKNRFDQIEQAANNKSVKYVRQLEKKYKTAAQELDGKINAWYQRIAKNNNVSMTEARRMLTDSELKEFKWTVQQYIEYGQQNAIDQSWLKQLENASAKFHINRLEALKLECRQQIEVALANGQQSMFDTLADVYKDTFYHSCFEIQKGMGVGFDVSKLDDKQVSKLLNKPWSVDGENFSTKVWKNKVKLINNLDQELSRMVLTGESPQKAIQNIKKSMDTSLYNAKRLVLTEQAYFCTLGQKDAFGELDVEEYEIVATLDNRTSERCRDEDGNHYPVKDMTPGVNAPPFHVFCRTTTCPYFNDEFTIGDKRAAKNEKTGEWYEVPSNMTSREWENQHVKDAMSTEVKNQYSKYQKLLGDNTPTIEDFAKIRYNADDWKAFKAYTSAIKSGELTPLADFELYQNISKQIDEEVVGMLTSNKITITGKTNHFIVRVIGSVEQKRSGVSINEIINTLAEPTTVGEILTNKNGRSQRFISETALVTVNPDTGVLIQVNPRIRRKKVNQ